MVPEPVVWQITVDWRGIEYEKLVMPMVYMRQAGCKFWVSGVGRSWRGLHLLLDSSADFIGIDHGFYAACNGQPEALGGQGFVVAVGPDQRRPADTGRRHTGG